MKLQIRRKVGLRVGTTLISSGGEVRLCNWVQKSSPRSSCNSGIWLSTQYTSIGGWEHKLWNLVNYASIVLVIRKTWSCLYISTCRCLLEYIRKTYSRHTSSSLCLLWIKFRALDILILCLGLLFEAFREHRNIINRYLISGMILTTLKCQLTMD